MLDDDLLIIFFLSFISSQKHALGANIDNIEIRSMTSNSSNTLSLYLFDWFSNSMHRQPLFLIYTGVRKSRHPTFMPQPEGWIEAPKLYISIRDCSSPTSPPRQQINPCQCEPDPPFGVEVGNDAISFLTFTALSHCHLGHLYGPPTLWNSSSTLS